MEERQRHWERAYEKKVETDVSWYQPHASRSLTFVTAAASRASPIIDVGGGASTLVDDLLERGYASVSILDIAEAGLAKARARLGDRAAAVHWIVADITRWHPPRQYAVWHDRALFHFLATPEARAAYVSVLMAGTKPGASVIMATFAPNGPQQCSGLPVQQYSSRSLAALLGRSFILTEEAVEDHRTPSGAVQPFAYSVFRRA